MLRREKTAVRSAAMEAPCSKSGVALGPGHVRERKGALRSRGRGGSHRVVDAVDGARVLDLEQKRPLGA